jgi:hypothetical protein
LALGTPIAVGWRGVLDTPGAADERGYVLRVGGTRDAPADDAA